MRILIQNGLWLCFLALLTACGQKGDLYLPQDSAASATPISTTASKESN